MKKLSQNGKPKWESRIGNLFDYPFDTAKVHTKVESTKYISSFFHTNRERSFAFFPSARALSIGSSRKTYTSLTTPGLYFISSRKCKIAQSAIYQKISRRLKLFLNIMFVKSPPQQFSVHFFLQPTDIFLVTPREKHHFVASLPPIPTIRRQVTGHIFLLPAASARPPPQLASRFGTYLPAVGEKLRIAPHCAPHTPPPRTKNGEPRRKNWGLSPKNGGVPIETPPFLPAGPRTRGASAHKKGLHPNSFVQSFIF